MSWLFGVMATTCRDTPDILFGGGALPPPNGCPAVDAQRISGLSPKGFTPRGRVSGLKNWLYPQLVRLLYEHADVVAQDLAEAFVDLPGIALAP